MDPLPTLSNAPLDQAHSCPHCGRRPSSPVTDLLGQPDISPESIDLQKLFDELEYDFKELIGLRQRKAYSHVKVLFLNWKECDLDPTVTEETIKLQKVFRDMYHFDAGNPKDVYRIPSKFSAEELNHHMSTEILNFAKVEKGKGKLMIVYYNGHGDIDENDRSFMITGGLQDAISFAEVHSQLAKSAGIDILLIMDCCFAARTVKSKQAKTMEALVAVSREVTAAIEYTGSIFTTSLLKHLQDCASRQNGFLVSELATLMHSDPILSEQSPQYIPLMGHHNPIILRPLRSTLGIESSQSMQQDVDRDSQRASESDDDGRIDVDIGSHDNNGYGNEDPFSGFMTIKNSHNNSVPCSYILDTASDLNLINIGLVHRLGLSPLRIPFKKTLSFKNRIKLSFQPEPRLLFEAFDGSPEILHYGFYTLATIRSINGQKCDKTMRLVVTPEDSRFENGLFEIVLGRGAIMEPGFLELQTQRLHSSARGYLETHENQSETLDRRSNGKFSQQANTSRGLIASVDDQRTNQILARRITQMQQLVREAMDEKV